ncbi:MAG: hypothetical protein EWV75_13300 [Microcystis wesenbergii Mw_QC_S_20081001_S30D]|uniref:Uncharacterized protein n=1 Tax=Microcystis wesenbergii Mw_QC_S_20081001_S30D TaxID=2486245 RepID=A0A552JJC5_9CHRO|nr:MAG: hypothetical protein EWV75_13300 [Microcystis wesenbergii Mw_QC_S_20081001_S30D]TRV01004.1 MAG: hypothetical protein EWV74_11430 [Microcystis wesenbergii Mw_QC_S_20081001_S30]TRV04274.1 MAG: hypothetical protein EWV73_03155 [Microcystis wesenbergii Mw_QC_B_20070930_S4D]TRV08208.1 MAG: hypothetical protein EWV89_21055 [Microcystis wesenbergii Mw_QC_B_20070930_S4]
MRSGVGFHASTQPTFILYLIPPTHLDCQDFSGHRSSYIEPVEMCRSAVKLFYYDRKIAKVGNAYLTLGKVQ